jgi:hypothetical protein
MLFTSNARTFKIRPVFALFQLRSFVTLRKQALPLFFVYAVLFCSHSQRICLAVLRDPKDTILDLQKHVYQPSHNSCRLARSVVPIKSTAKYVAADTLSYVHLQNILLSFNAKR